MTNVGFQGQRSLRSDAPARRSRWRLGHLHGKRVSTSDRPADEPSVVDRVALITATIVHGDRVEITVDLVQLLGRDAATGGPTDAITTVLTAPVVQIRRRLEVRLILADADGRQAAVVDPALAGLLGRSGAVDCVARDAVGSEPVSRLISLLSGSNREFGSFGAAI